MNNGKRKKLISALDFLSKAKDIAEEVRDQEEEDLSNLPENLYGTDRYESMEAAVGYLDDAISAVEEAEESLESAMT